MDGKCEGCGADMTIQRTHWDGCHTTHKQCAAFKAGREAGLREAAIDADAATRYGKTAQAHGFSNAPPWSELAEETKQLYRYAILSAIGGDK